MNTSTVTSVYDIMGMAIKQTFFGKCVIYGKIPGLG